MKKIIAMLLAVMLVASLAACGGAYKGDGKDTTAPAAQEVVPASALEILETVWNSYGDEEKFPVYGGNQNENAVMDAPGAFDITDTDGLSALLVPAEQHASVDGAATMVHLMNGNTFTCGVYHLTGDVNAFAEAMKTAVTGNRWMCGMPEKLLITVIGGEYVLVAFGINDSMTNFQAKLTAAYPGAKQVCLQDLV